MKIQIKKYYRILRGIFIYFRFVLFKKNGIRYPDKLVFFDLEHNRFERYFYLLCKFYLLEGYQIGIKINFNFIGNLETYSKLLLMEENVYFFWNKPNSRQYFHSNLNSKKGIFLSDYYFNPSSTKSYHVPMSLHPLMYHDGLWNERIPINYQRRKAVFFAGSIEKGQYDRVEIEQKFGIFNRIYLFESLRQTKYWFSVKNINELAPIQESKIYFLDRAILDIPMIQLRRTLSEFTFFFACPGVSMPFSHNIIEAMSVGCIPIIEENYARKFQPSFIHLDNALIFKHSRENLVETIDLAFSIGEEKLQEMINNVRNYYSSYLTPKNVIQNLMDVEPSTCFLNAEAFSASYIN
ncbi:MAG: hypothetical protein K9G36_07000 [Crocinitomicaceae bacterium]|nr:hypothetical protein [Crocinitomicaceae bacterium]MCF8409951.1 hypothetical protein [Crocinitomicaceae bacterium]MCF8444647.1 hypothetical protein [Crocinitomicaceae bacterium]